MVVGGQAGEMQGIQTKKLCTLSLERPASHEPICGFVGPDGTGEAARMGEGWLAETTVDRSA